MFADFSNYTLKEIGNGGNCYKLEPNDHLGGWVMISFLSGPFIAIHGDLCPGYCVHDNKGIISVLGKGKSWFSQELSAHYLAEKFQLDVVFRPDYARAYCQEIAEDNNVFLELAEQVDLSWKEPDPLWVDDFTEAGGDMSDSYECWYGYDEDNLDLLCAIQKAFAAQIRSCDRSQPDYTEEN